MAIPSGGLRGRLALTIAPLAEANRVIIENHYLHRGRTMAQIAYWIEVDDTRVGVMLFALPRLSVPFRGYHPMTLVELARLWVDPSVQGAVVHDRRGRPHSLAVASCAVGAALRRVREDWSTKYPRLPRIEACVSWADLSRHEGTIYRAANFADVGMSGGAQPGKWTRPGGGTHKRHSDYENKKRAFLYVWSARSTEDRSTPEEAA